jgi:hypothetical protein
MTPEEMIPLLHLRPGASPIPQDNKLSILDDHRVSFLARFYKSRGKDSKYMELPLFNFGYALANICKEKGFFPYDEDNLPSPQIFEKIPALYVMAKDMRLIEPSPQEAQEAEHRFAKAREGAVLRKNMHSRGLQPALLYRKDAHMFPVEAISDLNLYSIRVEDAEKNRTYSKFFGIYPTEQAANRTALALSHRALLNEELLDFLPVRRKSLVHWFKFTESLAYSEKLQVTNTKYVYIKNLEREGWVGPYKHVPDARLMRNAILCSGNWDPYFAIAQTTKP